MRIAIVCPDYPPQRSALADHTEGLARAIARWASVVVFTSTGQRDAARAFRGGEPDFLVRAEIGRWDWKGMRRLTAMINEEKSDWVIVQYVPHMYGRYGVNFALPRAMCRWRALGLRTLLVVHELYLDWSPRPRRLAAASAQRVMFWACVAGSTNVAISTSAWLERIRRWTPGDHTRFFWLPTPSNFEQHDHRSGPSRTPAPAPDASSPLTLGFFGTLHDSKLIGHLSCALEYLLFSGLAARLLCIGPSAEELFGRWRSGNGDLRSRIECTGYLAADEVVRRLGEVDIFLLPLMDGVSTRRSSLMAAMSMGLPVVGTMGHLTDSVLRDADVCRLVDVRETQKFADKVLELARNRAMRGELGLRAREFYRRECSWVSVAATLRKVLEGGGG